MEGLCELSIPIRMGLVLTVEKHLQNSFPGYIMLKRGLLGLPAPLLGLSGPQL